MFEEILEYLRENKPTTTYPIPQNLEMPADTLEKAIYNMLDELFDEGDYEVRCIVVDVQDAIEYRHMTWASIIEMLLEF